VVKIDGMMGEQRLLLVLVHGFAEVLSQKARSNSAAEKYVYRRKGIYMEVMDKLTDGLDFR
jgi:hypothetical protein